jgi:hypothetical protein
MNTIQISVALTEMLRAGKTVFMTTQPEIADYTSNKFPVLTIRGVGRETQIPLDPGHLKLLCGVLSYSVFSENVTVIGWNLKSLISHTTFVTGKLFNTECQMFDLKLLEAYIGNRDRPAPSTLSESLKRLKAVFADSSWEKLQDVHKKIHMPLIREVIPTMEVAGLLDEKSRHDVYSCYEIEGQKNGRMKCREPFKHVFNPHVIKPEDKERLLPRQRDEVFMYFDFHNMELAMVQWLSGDENLKNMMAEGDVYANIYKAIKGVSDRIAGKNLFLPVIYGESPERLAQEWEISYEDALYHVRALEDLFPLAFKWVNRECKNGEAEDHFGRKRKFEEESLFKVRNFYVQSPASLVCLEKLIRLHSAIKGIARLVCHVHDGYIVAAKKDTWREALRLSVDSLESPSEWCPGLKLSVGCQAGRKLNAMSTIRKG